MERRAFVVIAGVDIRSGSEEKLHTLGLVVLCGPMQGRTPCFVAGVGELTDLVGVAYQERFERSAVGDGGLVDGVHGDIVAGGVDDVQGVGGMLGREGGRRCGPSTATSSGGVGQVPGHR